MKYIGKRAAALVLSALMLYGTFCFFGCGEKNNYTPISGLNTDQKAVITIAMPNGTGKAMNTVANAFMSKYPNINVRIQYFEDYDSNASEVLKKNQIDMILQKDVSWSEDYVKNEETGEMELAGKTSDDYYYKFASESEIDFSNTTPDITNNYRHTRTDDDGNEITYQYSYPLGGETRGLFVNVTMLKSLGLEVPTNYSEFINCCEVVKKAGYVPIQGKITALSYGLSIPYAANTVVHNADALEDMKNAAEGVSAYFTDVVDKLYNIAVNRYADYKYIENRGEFKDVTEYGQAMSFLGLKYDENTLEVVKPENNIGYAAFFPYLSSTETVIRTLKSDYELDTEFTFICSPLNDTGSAPAYITPYYGICANKNSENLIWIREFINFLFQKDNIKTYAENASIIPNTADALSYAADKYSLNLDTDVTLCGQIRFSYSYNAYNPIGKGMLTVLKCNANKYMVDLDKDENGNIQYKTDETGKEYLLLGDGKTVVYREYVGSEDEAAPGYAFCTKAYYLEQLETEFAKYRVD